MLNHILHRDQEAVLSALGAKNLLEKEREKIIEQIFEHFTRVITDTAISKLDDGQIKEFYAALDAPDAEERITQITSHVPGLMRSIEDAVEQEFFALRSAKETLA